MYAVYTDDLIVTMSEETESRSRPRAPPAWNRMKEARDRHRPSASRPDLTSWIEIPTGASTE